jgi:hypothetical protein
MLSDRHADLGHEVRRNTASIAASTLGDVVLQRRGGIALAQLPQVGGEVGG